MMLYLKLLSYWIFACPSIIVFLLQRKINKTKIIKDMSRFEEIQNGCISNQSILLRLYKLLICSSTFRAVYYMRVGYYSIILKPLLKEQITCSIGATKSENIGGGVYIQHGWGMVLDAESVGENLWINQNVTVGYRGNGHPKIGNNVRIGSGAVVLGPITIGDNVKIGANAIVTKDVPSNTTVVSPHGFIIKRNGKRVHEEL